MALGMILAIKSVDVSIFGGERCFQSHSLVQLIKRDGNQYWIFKHPTIGDGYTDLLPPI